MLRRTMAVVLILQASMPAWAWNAHGHRTITYLALDGLPADAPAWLRDAEVRNRIAFQSNEPDRWRGWPADCLEHVNNPNHYLDLDDLGAFGLTLDSLPPLRGQYLRTLAVAKHVHPENVPAYDAKDDPTNSKEWPGFLPYAITEHYAALQAAFNQIRILESLNDPRRAFQLEQSRANAIYHMGMLSHFVGDAAQPLHTTRHHHGWVGENPNRYTTERGFHSFIDGRVLDIHGLTYASLKGGMEYGRAVDAKDPWKDVLAHIQRSFVEVEPLYRLERDKELEGPRGKQFIETRLRDGASMLAALYSAAWSSSAPTQKQIEDWVKYNNFKPELFPAAPTP